MNPAPSLPLSPEAVLVLLVALCVAAALCPKEDGGL